LIETILEGLGGGEELLSSCLDIVRSDRVEF
jgi:hypothetical protein